MTAPVRNETKKQENQKAYCNGIDDNPVNDLWTNGIIYAFEFVRGHKKALSSPVVKDVAKKQVLKKLVSSHELSQSAGDPLVNEDDIPVVLRSWQSQNFLVIALHVKGSAQNVNVLGISEVQVCSCSMKDLLMNITLLLHQQT
ncbi:hypothetical protein C1H46_045108 [Malus baccata]|uniref:Uncharacterized protein n=1 Tax=Malus baccata TaxID=106549 RepID=A0A540K550_MALBA|nr:hypothetical protein C1H46_045108 [Malus baccata]